MKVASFTARSPTKKLLKALEKLIGTEVDKRIVRPVEEIGALGTYKVLVKLTPEVQAEITVDVQLEGAPPKVKKEEAPATEVAEEAEETTAEEEPSAV